MMMLHKRTGWAVVRLLLPLALTGCFYIEGDLLGQPGITYECEVTCQKDSTAPTRMWVESVCDVTGQAEAIANMIARRIEPECSGRYVRCEPAFDFCTGEEDE